MPLFGGKHFSNPKVGMRHGAASGDSAMPEPMNEDMQDAPQEAHGGAHSATMSRNADGGFHVHIHHADDTHEHMDHPDSMSAMDHMTSAMDGGDESETEDNSSEEQAETGDQATVSPEGPGRRIPKGLVHHANTGAF